MKRAIFSLFILLALVVNTFMAQAHASLPATESRSSEHEGHVKQESGAFDPCGGVHTSNSRTRESCPELCPESCPAKQCSDGPCSGGHCTTHHHHRGGCQHSTSPFLRAPELGLIESVTQIYAERASQTLKPGPFLDGPFQPPRIIS